MINNLSIVDSPSNARAANVSQGYNVGPIGATLRFLPPYRPNINPVEQGFPRLKATLRILGKRCGFSPA